MRSCLSIAGRHLCLGMDTVLPNEEPYVPQIGEKVSIYVGEPLIFDELVQTMKKENHSLVSIEKSRITIVNVIVSLARDP
jgi:hypothetical protein